jgi:hypothetical protein
MFFSAGRRGAPKPNQTRLRFEVLEDKRLLAIDWANEFDVRQNAPNFGMFAANEAVARAIVNRAIDGNGIHC